MALYDGTDLGTKETKSDKTKADWSAGLKLLQSQMQLKRAQATLAQRDRTRNQPVAAPSVAPVVDLSRGKDKADAPSPSLLKPRKPLVIDGPPLSFISLVPKEEKMLIFGEVAIEDEYNPLLPNDYEKCAAQRETERRRQREEQRRKDAEQRQQRRVERHERDRQRDDLDEQKKRSLGAAIAPPPSLMEEDKKTAAADVPTAAPSFTPSFGAGSKGLDVAARIMENYGYKQGAGLGRQGQGISTALSVEKVGKQHGKIIHERDLVKYEVDESEDEDAAADVSAAQPAIGVAAAPPPAAITEILKQPTKVLLLTNMVGASEVDDDLDPEVREEMAKYGEVKNCTIFQMPAECPETEAIRIFIEFASVDQAIKAAVDLNGRYFGGRMISARFYDIEKFRSLELSS